MNTRMMLLLAMALLYVVCTAYRRTVDAEWNCSYTPDKQDWSSCCNIPHLITEQLQEICKQENQCSLMACVMNLTGIYTHDVLDENNLYAYLNETFEETRFIIPIVARSFEYCSLVVNRHSNREDKSTSSTANCTAAAAKLLQCVLRSTLLNCAKATWQNNQYCNDLREQFKNCKSTP